MSDAAADAAPPPAKVDPESLVLRGNPARVVRFRRGAILAIAALGSTAIVGVAWIALKPPAFRVVADGETRSEPSPQPPPDALAKAPRSYGDVPMLGPPLPGDLGPPILERQRSNEAALSPGVSAAARTAEAANAERQRLADQRKAARESAVMMQMSGTNGADLLAPAAGAPSSSVTGAIDGAADPRPPIGPSDSGNQPRNVRRFANSDLGGDIGSHALVPAASPYTLSAGSVIAASLITGLNSDLPGLVVAQVTENVYDSATGRVLLIPQGSRLIGRYESLVAVGQSRALVVWHRIILPDGSSVRIDDVPATDVEGYAGLSDRVDRHSWQLLKGVALSTLLGVGTELSFGSAESDLVRAVRESAQQSGARAGDQVVARSLDIQPTLRVRPGWPLRVIVHDDIVLRPWDLWRDADG